MERSTPKGSQVKRRLSREAAAKLSVVIPCYNEVGTIERVIRSVRRSSYRPKEVIVVDDCSTDGTRELLQSGKVPGIDHLICQERNQGKGAALRAGIRVATGGVIVIQDADLEYDPKNYRKMIKPILAGRADVVFGSRFIGSESHVTPTIWHHMANRVLTFLSNRFSKLSLTDVETGYKMFRHDALQAITTGGGSLRLGSRSGGEDGAPQAAHSRGGNFLSRTQLRRGKENRLARRRAGTLLHRSLQLVS